MNDRPERPTARIGESLVEIEDAGVRPVIADLLIEARSTDGIVQLGFAEVVSTGAPPIYRVTVNTRLRMSIVAALDLRNLLTKLLEDTLPGKQKAN